MAENAFLSSSKLFFTNLVLKSLDSIVGCPYQFNKANILYLWLWHCKLHQPGYYDFSTLTFSNYIKTYTEKPVVGIYPIGMELIFNKVYPGSISDSREKITEKNQTWLAGMKKNMKPCQIKDSLNRLFQENNPEEAANSDCSNKHSG